jgi:hypothetical protein
MWVQARSGRLRVTPSEECEAGRRECSFLKFCDSLYKLYPQ